MELRVCSFGEAEDVNEPATYITPHQLTSPAAIIADLAAQTLLSPLSLHFGAGCPCNYGRIFTMPGRSISKKSLSLKAVTAEDALHKEQWRQ